MEVLLHPATKTDVDVFLKKPVHALLLIGRQGSGRGTLASYIAANLLQTSHTAIQQNPYFLAINKETVTIPIEAIRSLKSFLRLKTPGTNSIKRTIVIESAQMMTLEAQNALLKLLEEPPDDTVFILTTTNRRALLPTVTSRTRHLHIKTLPQAELITYFSSSGYAASAVEKAYYMSGGQVGLMSALLVNDTDHPLVDSISKAKQILAAKLYERLLMIDELSRNKEHLPGLFQGLKKVSHAALIQATSANKHRETQYWHAALKRIVAAESEFTKNAQAKLLLTDLMLNI